MAGREEYRAGLGGGENFRFALLILLGKRAGTSPVRGDLGLSACAAGCFEAGAAATLEGRGRMVWGHPPLSATPTSPPQGGRLAAGGIAGLRGDGGEAEDVWTLEDSWRRRIVGLEDMDDGREFG